MHGKGLTDWAICTVCEKVIIEQQEIPQLDCEDLDGDLICDVCQQYITARMTEVEVEVGEKVAGHWYRLYRKDNFFDAVSLSGLSATSNVSNEHTSINLYNTVSGDGIHTSNEGNYIFIYWPQGAEFVGQPFIFTEEYIDIYIEAKTYNYEGDYYITITEDTYVSRITEGVVFKRLV